MRHFLYAPNAKVGMGCYPTLERNKEFKACREEFIPHLTYKLFSPEVLNVKKSLIKIAQNMLNFGRRIKIF